MELLWYIPNQVRPGHRGDAISDDHNSLDRLAAQATSLEDNGWGGALLGTGWGRPDTFTVATALAARTTTFRPLIAVRPGYWRPADRAVVSTRRWSSDFASRRSSGTPPRRPGPRQRPGSPRWPAARTTSATATAAPPSASSGCSTWPPRATSSTTISTPRPAGTAGAGAGTTWLVGSAQDVAKSLRKYADLGITHFVLSDTPYEHEIVRQGQQLLPLLKS